MVVVDPGFPRRGAGGGGNPRRGGNNRLLDKMFAKNCIKLKEIGQRGGTPLVPPWIRQSMGCVGFNVNVHTVRLAQQN